MLTWVNLIDNSNTVILSQAHLTTNQKYLILAPKPKQAAKCCFIGGSG